MSPTKYQDSDVTKGGMINGQHLSINKDSHMIKKSPSSSSPVNETCKQSQRQPVIIYTHTPKVIHVQARDFMAVVQRLTGMSPSEGEKPAKSEIEAVKEEENSFSGDQKDSCGVKNNLGFNIAENEASSALINDNSFNSQFLATNSNDFFCSSRFNSFYQSPSSFLDYNM